MSIPVLVITGVDQPAIGDALLGLQCDAPNAVTVRHTFDIDKQLLFRVVSDITGVIEQEAIDIEHACVSCALREDIMPTIERLASTCRWSAIITQLPLAAEATQICRILSYDERPGQLVHVASVVCVAEGKTIGADILDDHLLSERKAHTSADDTRSVGEALAALIEYADSIVIVNEMTAEDRDLVQALSRPGVPLYVDHRSCEVINLLQHKRAYDAAESWVDPAGTSVVGVREIGQAWTVELRSDRPFHPDRLLKYLPELGGGRRRSRGCFWLPTRPSCICVWDGAGGQLSVGNEGPHPALAPHTRILVTGTDEDRDELYQVFEQCLLTDDEISKRGRIWEAIHDGFEPWLGPIHAAA